MASIIKVTPAKIENPAAILEAIKLEKTLGNSYTLQGYDRLELFKRVKELPDEKIDAGFRVLCMLEMNKERPRFDTPFQEMVDAVAPRVQDAGSMIAICSALFQYSPNRVVRLTTHQILGILAAPVEQVEGYDYNAQSRRRYLANEKWNASMYAISSVHILDVPVAMDKLAEVESAGSSWATPVTDVLSSVFAVAKSVLGDDGPARAVQLFRRYWAARLANNKPVQGRDLSHLLTMYSKHLRITFNADGFNVELKEESHAESETE
jgi:hypothetical protein